MRIIVKTQGDTVTIVDAVSGSQMGASVDGAIARAWLTTYHAVYAGPGLSPGEQIDGLYDLDDEVDDGTERPFDLTCLVCQAAISEITQHNRSDLVALQEHLMEDHGLSPRDFARSQRHAEPGAGGEECYEWSLPAGSTLAISLNLREGRYMRACRVGKKNNG